MMPRAPLPLILVCTLALTACVNSRSVYYAEGVTLSTRAADLGGCQAEAQALYPVRMVTRTTPRVFVPGGPVCDDAGVCSIQPGRFEGGEPYRVDLNAEARRAAPALCMAARGYARITLPVCAVGSTVRPNATLPALEPGTCVMPGGGASAAIVTPF